MVVAEGGAHSDPQAAPATAAAADAEENLSPEEKMRRRFPQPVRVGDLIGLPLLDWDDSTLGYVRHVVRTPEGKIQLIVNQGRLFGWGGRLVQVPIEAVAILARQTRPARHIGGRISRRPRLVRGHHPADSIRRHDQDCSLASLIRLRRWRRSNTALLPAM